MSYVIQNFYSLNKLIIIIPKFKNLIINLNYYKFFFFFKAYSFSKFILNPKLPIIMIHNFSFFKFLYTRIFNLFFLKFNLNNKFNYTSNFEKSIIFFNLNNLNKFLSYKNFYKSSQIIITKYFLYNSYFRVIKIIHFKLNKSFYNNFFFYLLFQLNMWISNYSHFKFHSNFL